MNHYYPSRLDCRSRIDANEYAKWRGAASESAVQYAIEQLVGKPLLPARKKNKSLMARIVEFFSAKPNDSLDVTHADFEVVMTSDVNGGSITVPLQTKSSLTGKSDFERRCKKSGWGPIPCIVIDDDDLVTDIDDPDAIAKKRSTVLQKVKEALITGYNIFRRLISEKLSALRGNHWEEQWDGPKMHWTETVCNGVVPMKQKHKPRLRNRYFNLSPVLRGGTMARCA